MRCSTFAHFTARGPNSCCKALSTGENGYLHVFLCLSAWSCCLSVNVYVVVCVCNRVRVLFSWSGSQFEAHQSAPKLPASLSASAALAVNLHTVSEAQGGQPPISPTQRTHAPQTLSPAPSQAPQAQPVSQSPIITETQADTTRVSDSDRQQQSLAVSWKETIASFSRVLCLCACVLSFACNLTLLPFRL